MVVRISVLALLASVCGACSAPAVETTVPLGNPANPDAPSAPFVRPVNVLAAGGAPVTAVPSTAMAMGHGSAGAVAHGNLQMAQANSAPASATGTVNKVDAGKHMINVSHDPIKALGWPAMTMDFPVARSVDLNSVKPGSRISFALGRPNPDGTRQIEQLKPE
jgi:Cu(I)/Ag(I) efflux system protein CusF